MKFLKKINDDSSKIIQDLRGLNDSLIESIGDYQQHIYELLEIVKNQREEIERMQERNDELNALNKIVSIEPIEAIKEFAERLCDGRVSNDPVVIAVKCELKEMVGDSDA